MRDRQASEIEAWLAEVTPEQLARTAPVPDGDRWPPYARGRTVRQCLGTVLNEEWAHHGFCVRDLDKLPGQNGRSIGRLRADNQHYVKLSECDPVSGLRGERPQAGGGSISRDCSREACAAAAARLGTPSLVSTLLT